MMNAERWGKAAQSQVHAWSKPGTSHVLGRRLGGASQVHAWCMRHTSQVQARKGRSPALRCCRQDAPGVRLGRTIGLSDREGRNTLVSRTHARVVDYAERAESRAGSGAAGWGGSCAYRSEEHTSELQSRQY